MTGHQAKHRNKKYTYWISEPGRPSQQMPMLLIHGFGGTYSGLEELSNMLSANTTVIGLDLPGYGLSEPLASRHTLANYARFLDGFCETTQYHKLDLVGHSFGADIALIFAAMFPHRVNKLVLLSPVILGNRRKANLGKYYYDMVARAPKRLRHGLLHSHTLTRISDYLMFKHASERQRAKILRDDLISDHLMSDRPIIESYHSLFTTRFLRVASRVHVPTAIVVGDEDPLAPQSEMVLLHANIRSSSLEVVKDSGHFLPLEDPRKTAAIIRSFLA